MESNEDIEAAQSPSNAQPTEQEKKSKETVSIVKRILQWLKTYGKKFAGLHEERPKRLPWTEYLWSFLGSLLGIAAVAFLHFRVLDKYRLVFDRCSMNKSIYLEEIYPF